MNDIKREKYPKNVHHWELMVPFVEEYRAELQSIGINVEKLLMARKTTKEKDYSIISKEDVYKVRHAFVFLYGGLFEKIQEKGIESLTERQLNAISPFLLVESTESEDIEQAIEEVIAEEKPINNKAVKKVCAREGCDRQFIAKSHFQKYCPIHSTKNGKK